MMKKSFLIGMFFVVGILLIQISSAEYTRSFPAISQSGTYSSGLFNWVERNKCEDNGKDFIVQLTPLGCTPAVVRDDLLEENDVPVFCQLSATKINPLIDVNAIDSVRLTGRDTGNFVKLVDFQPRRAALSTGQENKLNDPLLNNLGYAVIVLKQQKNSSVFTNCKNSKIFGLNMGEGCVVEGNITATLTYDLNNAFGIGKGTFYLPELTDQEWKERYLQYGFWKGRGYLRVQGIDGADQNAKVVIYDDQGIISSVNLKKGQDARTIYLPGFDCAAGLELKLDGLEDPDTRARLKINGDVVEVGNGETFIDEKCQIVGVPRKQGLVQSVSIKCTEDNKVETFPLALSPKIKLRICNHTNGVECGEKDYGVGDFLYYEDETGKKKSVYLAFIGKEVNDVTKKKELYAYFVAIPDYVVQLDEIELTSAADFDAGLRSKSKTGFTSLNTLFDALNKVGAHVTHFGRWFVDGQNIKMANESGGDILGKSVTILGLGKGSDNVLNDETKDYYAKSVSDYDKVISDYPDTKYPDNAEFTNAENASVEKIKLTFKLNQKKEGVRLCGIFKEKYPESKIYGEISDLCDNEYLMASSGILDKEVLINGNVYNIHFDGIYEPDFEDYGVLVTVRNINQGNKEETLRLTKNLNVYLDGLFPEDKTSAGNYVELKRISDNLQEAVLSSPTIERTLKKGVAETIQNYTFTIIDINSKKVAKVSIDAGIDRQQTEVNFPFKIGIEKRGIKLSPDETKDKIDKLNKTIVEWEKKSNSLGNVTQGMKTACLGVNLVLMAKNFFANIGGKGIARQQVMRGSGGWYQKCQKLVPKEFSDMDKCLLKYSNEINRDVDLYYKEIQDQNTRIKEIEDGCKKDGLLGERVIDDSCFQKKYLQTYKGDIATSLRSRYPNSLTIQGKQISVDDFVKRLDSSSVSFEEIREIEFNSQIEGTQTISDMANTRLNSTLTTVYMNTNAGAARSTFETEAAQDVTNPKVDIYSGPQAITGNYEGSAAKEGNKYGIKKDTPIQLIIYNNDRYLLELEENSYNAYGIVNIYNASSGKKVDESNPAYRGIKDLISSLRKTDAGSYKNLYESSMGEKEPVLRYYETEPFKGLPALVPFDKEHGWYVSIEEKTSGVLRSYDDSGRINSFWLCNVWNDHIEQNRQGDDECRMINLASGMPYDQFNGLTSDQTRELVNRAVRAIQEASDARQKNPTARRVSITGFGSVAVGSPAVDLPDVQCQDIMSPSECKIMFNVCDPVICPSSRCDLGGAYPVKDVIQSGIVGSIALCLPNFPEVYIPVCLSGIKAGIDSWISVQKSTKDCLQTSLNTGETVGICDELNSLYACEFFWREAIPFTKLAVPKFLEVITGQNVRGGGEYLGVKDAWSNAESSINYFTQYYGANSYKAFKARSLEDFGGEFCKSYVSGVFPSGGDIIDTLTQPDSPSQFTGRFDEIPYTTTTNPPASQYKVFYHIFAGNDRGAYFRVYLKGGDQGSYYQDTASIRNVASGYIAKGGYKTETLDFLAPSGYKQLCIMVNEQIECGFQQVSTDFVVNYISDQYASQQANKSNIKTASDCISGGNSILPALVNPNIQEGAYDALNPSLYNYGIVRTCATSNPGKGTDEKWNIINESRWVDVGYCDDVRMRCWLDKDSVKNVIKNTNTESDVLKNVNNQYQDALNKQGYYVVDFPGEVEKISEINLGNVKETTAQKIRNITALLDKTFLSIQKAFLYLWRGNEYGVLANLAFKNDLKRCSDGTVLELVNLDVFSTKQIESFRGEIAKSNLLESSFVFTKETNGDMYARDAANPCKVYKLIKPSGEVKDSEEVIPIIPKKIEFSPVFEFRDGLEGVWSYSNLYYKYQPGGWVWSLNAKTWYALQDTTHYYSNNQIYGIGDKNKKFIAGLIGKDYDTGLRLLYERVFADDEDITWYDPLDWVSGITQSPDLKTTHITLSKEAIFEVKYSDETMFLKFASIPPSQAQKWWFSYKKDNDWKNTPTPEMSEEFTTLFNSLNKEGVDFLEGAKLIFNLDMDAEVVKPSPIVSTRTLDGFKQIINLAINYKDSQGKSIPIVNKDCNNYADLIFNTAAVNKEDPVLLLSLMQQESSCDPQLFSGSSVGLMQINLVHCGKYGLPADEAECKKLLIEDTTKNVNIGAQILREGYDMSRTEYESKIKDKCKTSSYQEKYLSYFGWDAALRLYNGAGCVPGPKDANINFVEEVTDRFEKLSALSK